MDPSVRALLRGSPVDLSPEFCEVLLWNQFLWKQFLVERSAILQSQHSRQLWLRLRNRFWSVKKINQRPLWHCCQCENALLINNRAGWFAQQCIIYSNTLITGHTIICKSQDLKSHSLSPVRFSARESLARQCTRLAAMYDAEDEFVGMMLPLDLPRQCEQASSISQLKIDQVDRITICLVRKTNKKKN